MDRDRRDQTEKYFTQAQAGIQSRIDEAIEQITEAHSRLEVIATVLPGTNPLEIELRLMEKARGRIKSLPAEIEKALGLKEALAKG